MSVQLITVLMFATLFALLVMGLPLVFVLGGLAMVYTYFLWGPQALAMVSLQTYGTMIKFILVAVPLFILMGNVLEGSGVADALYKMMHMWMGPLKGGLAMGTVVICALFAAMCGVSAAGTVTMGLVALPAMLRRGYNKEIALGCIAAAGGLGQLIPPSVMMIVYALLANESVGRLFAGGLFPGLLLAFLYMVYIGIRCARNPSLGPSLPPEERGNWREKFFVLRGVILPILLIVGVIGSIFSGIATPTEASAVGAAGALVCATIHRKLNWKLLREALERTVRLSGMIMWLICGALCFVSVYTATGGSRFVESLLIGLPIGRWGIVITMQLILLFLGCFIEPGGIMFLTCPVFLPVIRFLGFDVVWFGVLFVMNMEMAFLTPPFGVNLFYLKGVAPEGIVMLDIYRSIIPFVMLQIIGLAIVMIFPQIALWLPSMLFG